MSGLRLVKDGEKAPKKKVPLMCRLGFHDWLRMVLYLEDFDSMVFFNKCLRCGKDRELDLRGNLYEWLESGSPTGPYDWDA